MRKLHQCAVTVFAALLSSLWMQHGFAGDDRLASLSSIEDQHGNIGLGAPIPSEQLASKRGGQEMFTINEMDLKGVVGDNLAIDNITGQNAISGGAFSGMAGVPLVVQNSGNNVLIQNATILNLKVIP